jgi:hypothetical protein
MLSLGYFSKWPAAYKEREKSTKDVIFNNISHTIKEDGSIYITSSTDKYSQEILIPNEQNIQIQLNSPCKVFCTCESFKYEFANAVFRSGSLLKSLEFVRSIIKRPKEKNQYNIPSGCKHIVALSRYIIKHNHKLSK